MVGFSSQFSYFSCYFIAMAATSKEVEGGKMEDAVDVL